MASLFDFFLFCFLWFFFLSFLYSSFCSFFPCFFFSSPFVFFLFFIGSSIVAFLISFLPFFSLNFSFFPFWDFSTLSLGLSCYFFSVGSYIVVFFCLYFCSFSLFSILLSWACLSFPSVLLLSMKQQQIRSYYFPSTNGHFFFLSASRDMLWNLQHDPGSNSQHDHMNGPRTPLKNLKNRGSTTGPNMNAVTHANTRRGLFLNRKIYHGQQHLESFHEIREIE